MVGLFMDSICGDQIRSDLISGDELVDGGGCVVAHLRYFNLLYLKFITLKIMLPRLYHFKLITKI